MNGEDGNNVLRGGDGFDILDDGIGDDILAGGNGVDILRGKAQADSFVFTDVNQSTSLGSDLIDGHNGIGVAGGDVIDLTAIDANNVADGNDAFTFLGLQSTASGQAFGADGLWLENEGTQTHIFGNIDNDGVIDLVIRINDGAAFSAADYIAIDFLP